MKQITIQESGVTFGPFDLNHCFHIEKSESYKRISDGVKMGEFIYYLDDQLWVVEAKSTIPNSLCNPSDYETYLGEICEKLSNALILGLATHFQRHCPGELPQGFSTLNLAKTTFHLVLVIGPMPDPFLLPAARDLSKHLRAFARTWGDTRVWVMNEGMAVQHGLVTPEAPQK